MFAVRASSRRCTHRAGRRARRGARPRPRAVLARELGHRVGGQPRGERADIGAEDPDQKEIVTAPTLAEDDLARAR